MKGALYGAIFLAFPAFYPIVHAQEWGDPRGFLLDERVEKTSLAKGVDWFSVDGKWKDQALKIHVVRADLSQPHIRPASLLGDRFVDLEGGQFFQRSTVSQFLVDDKALAAINVAFFNISATQTPSGIVMKDGVLYREADDARPSVVLSGEGRAVLAEAQTELRVDLEGRRRPLAGINANSLTGDSIVAYFPPWMKSPGNNAQFTQKEEITEVLVEKVKFTFADAQRDRSQLVGTIKEIRSNRPGVAIGEDEFVLTATKSAAPFFRTATIGQKVKIEWELRNLPEHFQMQDVKEIVSSGPVLIRDGQSKESQSSFWTTKHPRSALGIHRDQKMIVLVVVDGRWDQSVGISLQDLTALLRHMGAYNALNFDGGGSSAMAAKVRGKDRLLNHPSSGGIERFVPTGMGVFLSKNLP